jgi:CDP-diacylglycerol--serine O-phosphatidyltransferase
MSYRLRQRLGAADLMTLANAAVGVVAMTVAVTGDPSLVARLVLLAAVADGLDGILARAFGSSDVGHTLDAMADVVSFGAAPALFVFAALRAGWAPLATRPAYYAAAVAVATLFCLLSLVRTAMYTVYFEDGDGRPGVQNTLAASILAAAYLAGLTSPLAVAAGAVVLAVSMVAPVPYPKLTARDALAMGLVQFGAILRPAAFSRLLPRVLLAAALLYMTLAPRFYWGE